MTDTLPADVDLDTVAQLPSELLAAITARARLREHLHDRAVNDAQHLIRQAGPPTAPPSQPWEPYSGEELIETAIAMHNDPWWTYQRAAPTLTSIHRRSNLPPALLANALGVFA